MVGSLVSFPQFTRACRTRPAIGLLPQSITFRSRWASSSSGGISADQQQTWCVTGKGIKFRDIPFCAASAASEGAVASSVSPIPGRPPSKGLRFSGKISLVVPSSICISWRPSTIRLLLLLNLAIPGAVSFVFLVIARF